MLGRAQPLVMMITGVNGAGKTTSIGKLAKHLQSFDQSVLLAAGDTFRAAAREQLAVWGERNNVTVVQQESGDPAAVIFDAVSARARKIDVMMADTAGRLPTQLHLMEELKKVKRVISKAHDGAPHEVLLVIDANTGQNALTQVKAFDDALGLTGLIVTKLDGTAKGGILAAIARQRRCRSASSALARRSRICSRSARSNSRTRCSAEHRRHASHGAPSGALFHARPVMRGPGAPRSFGVGLRAGGLERIERRRMVDDPLDRRIARRSRSGSR